MIKIVSLGVCQNMSGSGPGSPPAELDGVFPILYQNYSYFHKENVALVSKTTTENNGVTNIIDLT